MDCNAVERSISEISELQKLALLIMVKYTGIEKIKNVNWVETGIKNNDLELPNQPKGFKSDLKLYEYQLQALAW